ncbi:MAG: NPCBM/NEW2 domain-containing protein [Pirellulales bacterium]|nr:NPCBM/NEW2 domain-containing protein [Pirellulales bacterium]
MTSLVLICAAVLAANLEVELQTVAGESQRGELVAISTDEITLATTDGQRRWPLVDVLDIASAKAPAPQGPPGVLVALRDGSRVRATNYTTSSDVAQIELVDGAKLSLPIAAVHWVRWEPARAGEGVAAGEGGAAGPSDNDWQQFVERATEADLLVVRKKDEVDSVDGQIGDVGAETVALAFDDERLDVNRKKIVGLIYYRAQDAAPAAPLAKLQTADGSVWAAKNLTLAEAGFALETTAGAKVDVPVAALVRIDFSQGKVLYLSDLEWDAAQSQRTPYFGPPMPLDAAVDPYAPQRDRAFEGGELTLGRKTFRKGLALHSRTRLVFRLPEDYRRLTAVVGIDDRLSDQGNVKLEIVGDEKTLLSAVVKGGDPPLPLELDVSGVRRLTITVDFGDAQDVADHLDLCDLRIIK